MKDLFLGDSKDSRVFRGTLITVGNVGGSNLLRFGSNLLLTWLLMPEAFGLMALAQLFIYGLQTFSDVGINTSIIQSERGDDQDFLNTAWSLQILRGFLLWLLTFALAWPATLIYGESQLLYILPSLGLSLLILGFMTTREAQASRHLTLGFITALNLISQLATLIVMAIFAYFTRSVWALVIGTVIGSMIRVAVFEFSLPGTRNQWNFKIENVKEILSFGVFILFSTMSSFAINVSDRAILGAYIDVSTFGIFSIGALIGTLPGIVVNHIGGRVLFPLYRMTPPGESKENQQKVFKTRRYISVGSFLVLTGLAFVGIWVIEFLYPPAYALAGPMIALFCLRSIPNIASLGTQNVMLANGDSKQYFYLQAITALVQIIFTFYGVSHFGILGAILGPGVALLIIYPLRAFFASRYNAWDAKGELLFMLASYIVVGGACALYWKNISLLF